MSTLTSKIDEALSELQQMAGGGQGAPSQMQQQAPQSITAQVDAMLAELSQMQQPERQRRVPDPMQRVQQPEQDIMLEPRRVPWYAGGQYTEALAEATGIPSIMRSLTQAEAGLNEEWATRAELESRIKLAKDNPQALLEIAKKRGDEVAAEEFIWRVQNKPNADFDRWKNWVRTTSGIKPAAEGIQPYITSDKAIEQLKKAAMKSGLIQDPQEIDTIPGIVGGVAGFATGAKLVGKVTGPATKALAPNAALQEAARFGGVSALHGLDAGDPVGEAMRGAATGLSMGSGGQLAGVAGGALGGAAETFLQTGELPMGERLKETAIMGLIPLVFGAKDIGRAIKQRLASEYANRFPDRVQKVIDNPSRSNVGRMADTTKPQREALAEELKAMSEDAVPSEKPPVAAETINVDAMAYNDLRKYAKTLGVKASGKKAEIVGRIKEAEDARQAEALREEGNVQGPAEGQGVADLREVNRPEAAQRQEGEVKLARPDLANIGETPEQRAMLNQVDVERNAAGQPETRSDVQVRAEAEQRLQSDYEGEKAKAANTIPQTDTDVVVAREVWKREADKGIRNGGDDFVAAMKRGHIWREQGTEQGRAFRQRRDYVQTPAERRGEVLRDAALEPPPKLQRQIDKAEAAKDAAKADRLRRKWAEKFEEFKKELREKGYDLDNIESLAGNEEASFRSRLWLSTQKSPVFGKGGKVQEYWRNSILSGPPTQAANIIGNTAHSAFVNGLVLPTEAMLNSLGKAAGLKPKGADWTEVKMVWRSLLDRQNIADAFEVMKKSWRYESDFYEQSIGREGPTKFEAKGQSIAGWKGKVIRAPQRALLAADNFAKVMQARASAAQHSYRIARNEGLKPGTPEHGARMRELFENQSSAAWDNAVEDARLVTFTQELGAAGKGLMAARDKTPMAYFVAPFVTTPTNIFKRGLKLSPFGAMKFAKDIAKGDTKTFSRDLAEQTLVWSGTLALAAWNDPDNPDALVRITGSQGAYNYKGRKFAARSESQPFSIYFGNQRISYARIEPIATAMGLAVDVVEAVKSGDMKRMASAPFSSIVSQVNSKTFMQGVSDIIDAIQIAGEGEFSPMLYWSSNFTASWVPNIFRSTLRAWNPNVREGGVWGEGMDYALRLGRRTAEKTEILGPAYKDYPKYDLWGREFGTSQAPLIPRPMTDFMWRALSPIRTEQQEPFIGDRVIVRWNMGHPDEEYKPVAPTDRSYKVGDEKRYMTDEQWDRFMRTRGRLAARLVETEIVNPERPSKLDIDAIKKDISDAHAIVKKALIKEWTTGEPADLEIDKLAPMIARRHIVRYADVLASSYPTKPYEGMTIQESKEQLRSEMQEAVEWLNGRGLTLAEIRKAWFSKDGASRRYAPDTVINKFYRLTGNYRKYNSASMEQQ